MRGCNRTVDYLRISITDRCNEQCLYCLPRGFAGWKRRDEILSIEEIVRVVRVATKVGLRKFRVTGGEPLIRKGVVDLVGQLARLAGVRSLGMTTNGICLAPLAAALRKAGLQSLNISLDALDPSVYRMITRGDVISVLEGIRSAIAAGFEPIKLNTVLVGGLNEREIWPIVQFAAEHQLPVRFIERMPSKGVETADPRSWLSVAEVIRMISPKDRLVPFDGTGLGNGPARYYRLEKIGATVGFIDAMSRPNFCRTCNKLRLTAAGKIRPCLQNHQEWDLMPLLRQGGSDGKMARAFREAISEKPAEHCFHQQPEPDHLMTAIGG